MLTPRSLSTLLALALAHACATSGPATPPPSDAGSALADAGTPRDAAAPADGGEGQDAGHRPQLPLVQVTDVPLPGRATRFDYQDLDVAHGHLVLAHMNDGEVLILNLSDGSVAARLTGIPVARGVIAAPEVNRIFVTSSPNQLLIIDATALTEIRRVTTGSSPDGVGWDPAHQVVGVSDQGDGAVSLIAGAGDGARRQVPLGAETGNVVFDRSRGLFWVTVVQQAPPDLLVSIDPMAASVVARIPLPGCSGAHGLRLHPDGASAFIACEGNDMLARVALEGDHAIVTSASGAGPDVLSIDPAIGLLYVAAESGDLVIIDTTAAGLSVVNRANVGPHAHTVAADPATHRVFLPLQAGPNGTPVLRIMQPTGL